MNYQNDFNKINSGIAKHVPKLAEFINCSDSIDQYSKNLFDNVIISNVYLKRQELFKTLIIKQCKYLFGENNNINLNLDGLITANILDHNGILNNPILLSSHLITSASSIFDSKFDILSLNTALYPFNNPFYKGGLSYKEERIRLISKSKGDQLVYFSPPVNFSNFPDEIKNILENLDNRENKYAWEQAARINYDLWPLLFEKKLRTNVPKLITLNQDEVVYDLLENIIKNKQGFVYDMIFNSDFRHLVKNKFINTTGAWKNDNRGSFLFWAVDDKHRAVGLKLEDNFLVSCKKDFNFNEEITEENIISLMRDRKIYAGMVLIFGVLVFYSGMVPLAGYGSINYLNVMKDCWLDILYKNYKDEYDNIKKMNLNKLVGGPILTYQRDENKNIKPSFMLDILMSGGLRKEYLEKIFSFKYNELLRPAFIDIYNTYIPGAKREAISITPNDIISDQLSWI